MPLQKQRQRKLLEGTMKKQLEAAECSVAFDETYQLVVPERPGYTFSGWYCGEEKLTDGDGKSILAWTFAEDRQLTAGWTINSYELTVTNDSACGEITDISGRKHYNEEITVRVEAACLGYTFVGWYEGEKLLGTELSYTFSMPAKDVTYTAKWAENEKMAPFDFTSTPTTCVVTGVKDKTARSFVVPDYVTEIGEGAFSGCGSLESLTLPFAGRPCRRVFGLAQHLVRLYFRLGKLRRRQRNVAGFRCKRYRRLYVLYSRFFKERKDNGSGDLLRHIFRLYPLD